MSDPTRSANDSLVPTPEWNKCDALADLDGATATCPIKDPDSSIYGYITISEECLPSLHQIIDPGYAVAKNC